MKRSLGPQESLFFALMQMRGQRTVRTGELIGPMGITSQQEEELLRRLARGRLIARVRRGLYLIPSRLPVGGSWSPDEVLALNTLIEDRGGRYQICGPNAFDRYGFDDQIPTRVYAYNDVHKGVPLKTMPFYEVHRQRLEFLGRRERFPILERSVDGSEKGIRPRGRTGT